MKPLIAIAALAAALAIGGASAQVTQATGPATAPAAAEPEVQATLGRYARAWYEGNAELMAGQLHPEFRRATVRRNAARADAIDVASGLALLDMTDRGFGRTVQPAARKAEVRDLKVEGGRAQAVLALSDRVEQVQLARWNNAWRVIHVLTERNEP